MPTSWSAFKREKRNQEIPSRKKKSKFQDAFLGISLNGNLIFSAISHDEWDNDLFDVHTCLHNNNCWDPDKNLNESLEITSLFFFSIAIIFIIVAWKKSHKNFIALMCRYFWWFYRWQNFYFFRSFRSISKVFECIIVPFSLFKCREIIHDFVTFQQFLFVLILASYVMC